MARVQAPGQTVNDLIRRSAGIPAAFMALLLGEPSAARKTLLPSALSRLLALAQTACDARSDAAGGAEQGSETNAQGHGAVPGLMEVGKDGEGEEEAAEKKEEDGEEEEGEEGTMNGAAMKKEEEGEGEKEREEEEGKVDGTVGFVPVVHAFNILRAAFHDTNLATDVSGYLAPGLQVQYTSGVPALPSGRGHISSVSGYLTSGLQVRYTPGVLQGVQYRYSTLPSGCFRYSTGVLKGYLPCPRGTGHTSGVSGYLAPGHQVQGYLA